MANDESGLGVYDAVPLQFRTDGQTLAECVAALAEAWKRATQTEDGGCVMLTMCCVDVDDEHVVRMNFPHSIPITEALRVLGIAARGVLESGKKLGNAKGLTDDEAFDAMGF